MRAPRPSAFFARRYRDEHLGDVQARVLTRHRRRRLVALVGLLVFLAIAVGGAVYLSTPRDPISWPSFKRAPRSPEVVAAPAADEPGAVDLQVKRGRKAQTYRFRKVGEDWSIREVTPDQRPRRQSRSHPPTPPPTPSLPD